MQRRRFLGEDGGHLLLLAGVILVLSFVVTALTLNQVANMEKRQSAEQDAHILDEYKFLRTELNRTLDDTVTTATTNMSFNDTFDRLVGSLEVVMNSRGYDVVVVRGAEGLPTPVRERQDFTLDAGGSREYAGGSFDGRRDITGHAYDGADDGIVWYQEAGDESGHIKAAVVYVYLSDQTATIEEGILLALNT